MKASRMGIRVSARRSRKIQRTLRIDSETNVKPHATSSRAQNRQGASGVDPNRVKTSAVAMTPTTRTAPDIANKTTHTIARGGRAARGATSAWGAAITSGAMVFPGSRGERGALADFTDHVGRLVLRLVIGA